METIKFVNVKELLIKELESFGYPVYLQGSMAEDVSYPNSFFTFWNPSTDEMGYYDDNPNIAHHVFMIGFYSTDPNKVFEVPREAVQRLSRVGFIRGGLPVDAMSDEPSHTGAIVNVSYIERYKKEVINE